MSFREAYLVPIPVAKTSAGHSSSSQAHSSHPTYASMSTTINESTTTVDTDDLSPLLPRDQNIYHCDL